MKSSAWDGRSPDSDSAHFMKILLPSLVALSLTLAASGKIPQALIVRMDKVIEKAHARPLRSDTNTPWVVMHAVVAFEKKIKVFDLKTKKSVNAIDYLTRSAEFEGQLIYQDVKGVPTLKTRGKGDKSFLVQDHVDQFLFAYADAGILLDHEIISRSGTKFTVGDKLKFAKKGLSRRPGTCLDSSSFGHLRSLR